LSLAVSSRLYGASIARVFFITAGTFGSMSLYGYTTKRDLSHFRSFLFMGLIGIVIAGLGMCSLVPRAQLTISDNGVIVFVGLTAGYARIKRCMFKRQPITLARRHHGRARALSRFPNLFLMLMQLLGDRRR